MITRRFLLAISPAAILGLRASAFTPGDSWSSKQPEDWSEKDIHQILTKSPWAKQVPVDFGDLNGGPPGGAPGGVLQAVESAAHQAEVVPLVAALRVVDLAAVPTRYRS